MKGVQQGFIFEDKFWLIVARVDCLIIGAGAAHELAAIRFEGLEKYAAVPGERVDAMLPLHNARGTAGCGRCTLLVRVS